MCISLTSTLPVARGRKTVLLICRHTLLPRQIAFLTSLYGKNFGIHHMESDNVKLDEIINCINKVRPVDIIAVLPLEMIISLMDRGFYPLYAEMTKSIDLRNCDIVYDGYKGCNFDKFVRYSNVRTYYFPTLFGKYIMKPAAGFKPTSNKILLFSGKRTSLSEREKTFLRNFYRNPDLQFEAMGRDVDINWLVQAIKNGDYLDVIVEAPKSVLNKLTELGLNPLMTKIIRVIDGEPFDIEHQTGSRFKFKGFKRLQRLIVDFSDPKLTNLFGQSVIKKLSA